MVDMPAHLVQFQKVLHLWLMSTEGYLLIVLEY